MAASERSAAGSISSERTPPRRWRAIPRCSREVDRRFDVMKRIAPILNFSPRLLDRQDCLRLADRAVEGAPARTSPIFRFSLGEASRRRRILESGSTGMGRKNRRCDNWRRRGQDLVWSGGARTISPGALAIAQGLGHMSRYGRCGREAEGGGLLNRYRVVKPYRGFESLRLRH